MSLILHRIVRVFRIGAPLVVLVGLACTQDSYGPQTAPNGFSVAFGIWTPGPSDTCTLATHDKYSVVGPDGKLYPTWHPPVDPETGCSFGHEHGRDPRGSDLYGEVGAIPFGYANEQLDTWDPTGRRHEDHFGHKMEWENDIEMNFGSAAASQLFDLRCDLLVKMHQGTHSKDAFTNNLHELVYHVRCTDGTEMHVTMFTAIGTPGEFVSSCTGNAVVVGTATPPNSPNGGGRRIIPDKTCADSLLVPAGQRSNFGLLHESWQTSNSIRGENGQGIAHFDPYFQATLPSRFYDPAAPNVTGRPIDVCYLVGPNGERASGGPCDLSTGSGTVPGVTFNDPRSRFNGATRIMDINSIQIRNAEGPRVWFTDPFGRTGRPEAFPGSIRQVIARINNDLGELNPNGPGIGRDRPYGSSGVHAPN